jgi:hypothetical protein
MLSNGIHIGRRGGVRLTGGGGSAWWLAGGIDPAVVVAAYQPKGAASLAASYVNLANPGTNDAAPGVAPTFDAATGWTFNGTQNLVTGILATGTTTIVARFSDASNNGYLLGVSETVARLGVSPRRGTGTVVRYLYSSVSSFVDISPGMSAGVLGLAGPNRYRDGASDGAFSAETFTSISQMRIGAATDASAAAFAFFSGNIIAVAIASSTLTAGQVAALSAAMAAL